MVGVSGGNGGGGGGVGIGLLGGRGGGGGGGTTDSSVVPFSELWAGLSVGSSNNTEPSSLGGMSLFPRGSAVSLPRVL